MEEIFNAKIENIDLPFKHCFTNQDIWIKIINNGKFLIANNKNFDTILEQFEIVDKDIKAVNTKLEVKKKDFEKTEYPTIEIEKREKKIIIRLFKSGYPNSPLTIKTSANNQSFVGSERPTMKLLLNGSFGSFFNTMGLS